MNENDQVTLKEFLEVQIIAMRASLEKIENKLEALQSQNLNMRVENIEDRCKDECLANVGYKKKLDDLEVKLDKVANTTNSTATSLKEFQDKMQVFLMATKYPKTAMVILAGFLLTTVYEILTHFKVIKF